MTRVRSWLVWAAIVGSGCTAEFFVGGLAETEGASTSGGGTTSSTTIDPTQGMSTSSTTSGETSATTESTEPATMSTSSSSSSSDSSSSSSSGTSGGETTPVTESSAEGPLTTTGDLPCNEIETLEECEAQDGCLWDGDPKLGVCVEDPCFMNECEGLPPDMCMETASCMVINEESCFSESCVPCTEVLSEEVCLLAENCAWIEEMCVE